MLHISIEKLNIAKNLNFIENLYEYEYCLDKHMISHHNTQVLVWYSFRVHKNSLFSKIITFVHIWNHLDTVKLQELEVHRSNYTY